MTQLRGRVRSKAIEKRQRILDSAAKILAAKGYAGLTIQEVADEVGMYAPNIHYYFPSKDDLIGEVLKTAILSLQWRFKETLDRLPPGTPHLERIRQSIRAIVRIHTSPDHFAIAYVRVYKQLPKPLAEDVKRHRTVLRKFWRDLFIGAQRAGELSPDVDVKLLGFMAVGATHWVSNWYKPDGHLTPERIADAFTDVLLYGATQKRPAAQSQPAGTRNLKPVRKA